MANYRNDFADVNLETGTICRNFMNHSIGSGDALGDRFGVRVFRNGEPVSLGGTVAGYFVRNTTGETVVISSGVVSGNEAYVTLPAACYAVEGSFTLAIKVTSGSETVTMRIIDGVVSRTNTSVTVDPGTLVPSIETLISAINSAVGQIPVNYNASFAPAYSASSTYAVGDYVVYDGYLWRCTTAITETESWTAAHWTKVALASDVSDLKSASDYITGNTEITGWTENYYIDTSVSPVNTLSLEPNGKNRCKVIQCSPGDMFTLTLGGGSAARAYAFIKSNGDLIFHSAASESAVNTIVKAPANTAYLVLNDRRAQNSDPFVNVSYYGEWLAEHIEKIDTNIKNTRNDLNSEIIQQLQYTTNGDLGSHDFQINKETVYSKSFITADMTLAINISGSSDKQKLNVYRVSEGDVIHLKGTSARLSANLPFAGFYEYLDSIGILVVNGSNTATDYDVTYTAPENGYIVVAENTDYNTLSVFATKQVVDFTDFNEIRGDTVYTKDGDALTEDADYNTYYIKANGTIVSLGNDKTNYDVHEIAVEANQLYLISGNAGLNATFPIAGFKTTSGTSGTLTILAQGSSTKQQFDIPFTPTENGYIFIASYSGKGVLSVYEAIKSTELAETLKKADGVVDNPWYGKKVVWLGTSVSFGQNATKAYPQEAANYYGFNLVNCSVPGLAIELEDGGLRPYGSLVASIAEYAAAGITIADAPITPYVPGGDYNNYYRTWEHVFTQENADADLWVFDVAPNNRDFDLSDWNAFNKNEWRYNDNSSFADHRDTFYGALLFLLNKLYELNPKARFVFVLGCTFQYTEGKTAFQTIGDQWNIGLIDLWGKIITTPPSLQQLYSVPGASPDRHPSTYAHELMGKMLVGEFNRFA